jgi:hypothetical protein
MVSAIRLFHACSRKAEAEPREFGFSTKEPLELRISGAGGFCTCLLEFPSGEGFDGHGGEWC